MNRPFKLLWLAGALGLAPAASAGDLVHTPINPSFGGNPLNGAHLLGTANAQRSATARDAGRGSGPSSGPTPSPGPGTTDADLFVRQLQSRMFSALAAQVTDAIFGPSPQDAGTVKFGDTTVQFERTLDSIRLVIQDATGTTEIIVPQLIASGLN